MYKESYIPYTRNILLTTFRNRSPAPTWRTGKHMSPLQILLQSLLSSCFPFFPLSHFSQPVYRAHRVCAASQHEKIFTFLNASESMQPLFGNFLPKLHSTLQQPNQMATNSPNVLLMSENRLPILNITYRVFSLIYGWTCSCSFYSLELHLSYWPFIFSRFQMFPPTFYCLVASVGDAHQQLTLGKEGNGLITKMENRAWTSNLSRASLVRMWEGRGASTFPEELPVIWGGSACIRLWIFPDSIGWW